MKKKLSVKLLSVVLAMFMAIAPFAGITAAAKENIAKQYWPLIDIPGFMASDIYTDKNDPSSDKIFPWDANDILAAVGDCIPALLKFTATRNYDDLADAIVPAFYNLFEPSMCDNEGNPKGDSGAYMEYPAQKDIHKDSELTFRYDWRTDPVVVAAQLNDFIDYVLDATGCEKVAITCHSLGGVMFLTYISIYGTDKVYGVGLNSTAIYGETYTGQLFSGDITIVGEALIEFLNYAFDQNDLEYLLDSIFAMLEKAGLADFIANLGNTLIENLIAKVMPTVVGPLFCNWLTIWAMVPDEYFDSAWNYMFTHSDPETDYSVLQEKILNFNKLVRNNKTETLRKLDETARVLVISRYGYSSIPLTPDWTSVTDGTIDAFRSSYGATVAPYGEQLTEEQLEGVDPAYISPDKTVNASTCLFPEKTWFIKDYKHANTHASLEKMMYKLLFNTKGESTVDSYAEYPRFLKFVEKTEQVVPDNGESKLSGIKAFIDMIRNILDNIYMKILKAFGLA